ncbi:MAG: hypothetical protein AMJ42_05560 [Deltaproteobacteria bacterium DG_8]|nr:MAG: hypothetical protein AMJ42_05560 [Deltaproteobacteria bacterium DG_8]
MTSTTHVAVSCLITASTIQSDIDNVQKAVIVAAGSLLAHLILDIVPHGFIATPFTIFKKVVPTITELLPGLLILTAAIGLFGNALLFLIASFFGILPDMASVMFYKRRGLISRIPSILLIHKIHRKVHWFETEHEDGTVSYIFPNTPLLVLEAIFTVFVVVMLVRSIPIF